ncbi:MAG: dUTP diphosphatase [Oligoflexia bacterium]|nr:dUTP diphosphatase [Oligoflexia bacterium]
MEQSTLKTLPTIEVKKFSPEATLPTRAHADDAGLDLYSLEDVLLEPQQGKVTRTGIALAIPAGHVGLVADRSSLAKRGVKTAGGVIDAGYRGEIHIVLWNISGGPIQLKRGERIAQLMILPIVTPAVLEVQELDETARGLKGFGSSGK